MISAVSAFRYERWPRVTRVQAALLRSCARSFGGEALQRGQAQAEALLGTSLRIAPGAPTLLSADDVQVALAPPQVVLLLEQRASARVMPVAVELAPELGAQLVDRVLGGEGRPGHVPGETLDDLSLGVLAYLAARVLAAAGGGLQVRGASTFAAQAAALLPGGDVLAWPFSLELGGCAAGGLRVFAGEQGAALFTSASTATFSGIAQALRGGTMSVASERDRAAAISPALRAVPVTLCAHAARATLLHSELVALACGDVVIPERCALARAGRGFAGQVHLHAIGSGRGGWLCSARGSELAIDGLELSGETTMSEGKRIETQALELGSGADALRAASDAPIELCLELARFTLPLGELTALRPGEVLSTGRAIGESVTLSAGGRAFARGELVDVDGEIGVRVSELC